MSFSNTAKDGSGLAQWLVSDADGNLKQIDGSLQAATVLSSTQRTTTTTSNQTNPGARGVLVYLNVSGAATTSALTLSVRAVDPVSSNYIDLLTATTAATTTGTKTYIVYPGVGAAGASVDQVAGFGLPLNWSIQIAHADTSAKTYSIGADYLP